MIDTDIDTADLHRHIELADAFRHFHYFTPAIDAIPCPPFLSAE